VHLTKHHGLGNDFLVALDEGNGGDASAVGPELARRWCDRRRGIGADGLIRGARPSDAERADGIDVVMHLFNADGSRAEMSGNGIRCLGQALAVARGITEGTVTVLTDAGLRPLTVAPGADADTDTAVVSVGMGVPASGPRIPDPLAEQLDGRVGTVDMGNPHLVLLVDDPASIDLAHQGAWLERQFPEGVNVEFIAVPDPGTIELRVWERGAGITEACGTGACAAAHEARRWDLAGDRVRVRMPGGDAEVVHEADGSVTLIGPAVLVGTVELHP
jgi:diaminopimelate epimerase